MDKSYLELPLNLGQEGITTAIETSRYVETTKKIKNTLHSLSDLVNELEVLWEVKFG